MDKQIRVRVALLGLLFGAYFGSLWVAALHFPHPYDWRRNVISNLLSPRDNPHWYWVASAGLAVAGLCMLPLAAWIERELGDGETKLARRIRRPAVLMGIVCLILSAIVAPRHAQRVIGMRHAHELLARTSAAGLTIGMLCACSSAALASEPRRRALRTAWRAVALAPILGAAGSGLLVAIAHLPIPIAAPADFLRGTVFWHLAFWEWIGSGAVFLFFASAVGMLGRNDEV